VLGLVGSLSERDASAKNVRREENFSIFLCAAQASPAGRPQRQGCSGQIITRVGNFNTDQPPFRKDATFTMSPPQNWRADSPAGRSRSPTPNARRRRSAGRAPNSPRAESAEKE
jgi:hypothetical protein